MANNTAFTYPMKRTKYFRPTPCANHQRKTMIAMNAIPIPRVNQFLAHHKVRSRHVPRNMDAILDAKMLNPHMTSTAPIAEEPRYPAGSVQYGFPPCWLIIYLMCKLPTMVFFFFFKRAGAYVTPTIRVAPPSSGSISMDSMRAHVKQPATACENSCSPTVNS